MRTASSAAVFLLLCVIASPALSVTRYITDDGLGDYSTIQAAIDASVNGDTIILADGTFSGAGNWDLDFGGRNIVVKSENGRIGCVIDCGDGLSGEHRGFHFHSGEDSTAAVEDITIREGYVETMEGGGILIENGSAPTIRDCVIEDCRAIGNSPSNGYGGGIAIFDSSPRITGNNIYANSAKGGGGIYLENSSAVIMGNDIYSNSSDIGGGSGGIYSNESTPLITGNWFDANTGGGMVLTNYITTAGDVVMHNNLFTHNMGPGQGLVWGLDYSSGASITNCTFFNNSGGGVYINSNTGSITDCIFYNNGTTEIDAPSMTVTYCWVEGGYTGTGNITGTSIAWDYGVYAEPYLPEGSECLDAGSGLAKDICSEMQYGYRCLNQMSALQSERPDTGQVDIGYHYTRNRTTLYVPGDAAEIQVAIESSVDGDRIEVDGNPLSGAYSSIDFLGRAVHVIGVGIDPVFISGWSVETAVTFTNRETSSSILENINIIDGAGNLGGGILMSDFASPVIKDCTVKFCSANFGGGLFASFSSSLLQNVDFMENVALYAGGMYFNAGSPEVRDCRIIDNTAEIGGGACCFTTTGALFHGCEIRENLATGDYDGTRGGGIYSYDSNITYSYCSFSQNTAQERDGIGIGGGMYVLENYFVTKIDHCVFSGNTALSGAGIAVSTDTVEVENSIIAFNRTGEAVYCEDGGVIQFSCSDIYNNDGGDWTGCVAGQDTLDNNFRADPVFMDMLNDELEVAPSSHCAAANNPSCGLVGIGTFDLGPPRIIAPDGSGEFINIQDAIPYVWGGGTILLEDGVYTGAGNIDISFNGKSLTIKSLSGDSEQCVIDCGGGLGEPHRAFMLNNREGSAARIEGITIRNGWTDSSGGGVVLQRSHPTIKNCIFENCHAFDGGGISTYMSEGLIDDCGFDSCTADDAGGGIFNHTSNPTVRDCWFLYGYAIWGGGGLYNHYSSPFMERCTFGGCTSDHWGGAVHNNHPESMPILQNCSFNRNASPNGGAMFSRNSAAPVVYNSIIAFSTDGVAVHTQTGATTTVYCCDVYGNDDGDYVGGILGQDGANGNFSADPLFCNEYVHYLRLDESSPCTQANAGACGLIGAVWESCHPTTDVEEPDATPKVTRLFSCYPNPFNPSTRIAFDLSAKGHVSLRIYDAAGRLVRTLVEEDRRAGRFEEVWNGTDNRGGQVASGVYFYRLTAKDFVESKKMILLR